MNIAYKDSSSFGKRTYVLDGDIILVKAVAISGSEHEVRVDIGQLDPNYDSLRVRGPLLVPLSVVALVGLVGTSILTEVSSFSHLHIMRACS